MRTRRALLALALLAAAGCSGGDDDAVAPGDTATTTTVVAPVECPSLELERSLAVVADPDLDEISGAATSPTTPGVTWVHEDSGNPPVLVALAADGSTLSRWRVTDVTAIDWEDMAAAVSPAGRPTLFVGDIGDNRGVRDHLEILRISEPDPRHGDGAVAPDAVIRLELPAAHDAEALLVDPSSGDIVVVTKDVTGEADVHVAPGAAWGPDTTGEVHVMEHAGTLSLGLLAPVLAGDVSPDGDAIVLRTPSDVRWFARPAGATVVTALVEGEPCAVPGLLDPLGEAVATRPRGGYVMLGEGVNPPIRVVA